MPETTQRRRLTREESQAQTRERLLEAAHSLFVAQGIDATSIEEVAEMAGYSRGAFYSNFENKDELICAALERHIRIEHAKVEAIFLRDVSPMERLAILRAFYIQVSGDSDGCMFWMAMQLYALRNGSVRQRIALLLRRDRGEMVDFVRRVYEELGIAPPAPAEVVAFSLIAQAQGLSLSRMLDPEAVSAEQFREALGVYFDRLIGLSAQNLPPLT